MKKLLIISILISFSVLAISQTTQWRGEKRDGKFNSTNLLKEWPENGPEKILVVDSIGKGWSSVIYDKGIIYVTGMIDTLDYLSAIDMNGEILYQIPYGRSWLNSFPDTRSTPTLEDGKIYLVSGIGELSCIDATNGKIIWTVDVDKDYKSDWSRFGVSESPLIVDDKIVCTPGGEITSMVAFDKVTGDKVWQTESVGGKRIYASPTLYTNDNSRFIMAMTNEYIFAVNPNDGNVIWKFLYMHKTEDPEKRSAPFTNIPTFSGNDIFISCGYDYHCAMLELSEDGLQITEKWTDTIFDNHHHGLILHDGYLYGSNWENNRKGNWICMDWKSGEIMYEHKWGTKGEIVYADGLLYLYEEKSGNIGLVRPNPEKFDLISSFKLEEGEGPYWAHPSIFDGKLFMRHGTNVVVYNIKKE